MNEYLKLLGFKVKDKVTGVTGVVTSVCFDLYGCVQATISQGINKEGKILEQYWFDVKRLTVLSKKPVMAPPKEWVKDKENGPAAKPLQRPV